MTEVKPSVWEIRLHALVQELDSLKADVAAQGVALPRSKVFIPLIEALRSFGIAHFNYFNHFFYDNTLNKSDNYPPDYVMRQVIVRIAEDIQVIRNCIDQRRPLANKPAVAVDAQAVLLTADKLAWAALQPAIEQNLLPNVTTAITYFQKDTTIRVIPYASVALIGIPITCLTNTIDYLATPHEIGHYVYWNSRLSKDAPAVQALIEKDAKNDLILNMRTTLKAALSGEEKWTQRWIQEIFADSYGALVAQGAIALSFQDLENESSKTEFILDDSKHPLPVVRPDIYSDVIAYHDAGLAGNLHKRWIGMVQKRQNSMPLDSQGEPTYLIVGGSTLAQSVQPYNDVKDNYTNVVTEISKFLALKQLNPVGFPGRDETDLGVGYDTFTAQLEAFIGNIATAQIDPDVVAYSWDDWMANRIGAPAAGSEIPVKPWMPVLCAGGWTTEGPHGRDIVD
jgi:hypothetical protein